METKAPTPRKLDVLDELNELRYQRRLSYEGNNMSRTRELNLQIKALRLDTGWSETDADAELKDAVENFEKPFIAPVENPFIKYDLNDENGNPRGLSLTISQVNKYWNRREGGLSHTEALNESLK